MVALVLQIGQGPREGAQGVDRSSRHQARQHPSSMIPRAVRLFVKLLDFGTARREGGGDVQDDSTWADRGHAWTTPARSRAWDRQTIDERSDIWSLGVVAFEALTGRSPSTARPSALSLIAIHGVLPKMTTLVPEQPAALDEWFRAELRAGSPGSLHRAYATRPNALCRSRDWRAADRSGDRVGLLPRLAPTDEQHESMRSRGPIRRSPATLPERGAEKRVPTIAAGIVMATAAVAMIAIILGRSPQTTKAPASPEVHMQAATPPPEVEPRSACARSCSRRTRGRHHPSRSRRLRPRLRWPKPAPLKGPAPRATEGEGRDARAKTPKPAQRGARTPTKDGTRRRSSFASRTRRRNTQRPRAPAPTAPPPPPAPAPAAPAPPPLPEP